MRVGDLVTLNKKGETYLIKKNKSYAVGVVYNSLRIHSAQIIGINNRFAQIKLCDSDFSEKIANKNNFYIHCEHLTLKNKH